MNIYNAPVFSMRAKKLILIKLQATVYGFKCAIIIDEWR